MLGWQVDLGVSDAIGEVPVNRYEVVVEAKKPKPKAPPPVAPPEPQGNGAAIAAARQMAAAAPDLIALKSAMAAYDHCELKKGARNLVFADGNPTARLMVIGEAPGRDEDRLGFPFVGKAGQLLDNMLAAIDLSRKAEDAENAVYITNVLPWRPPQNRDPSPDEIAMMLPFLARHIELVQPDFLVLMGNITCQALLGKRGITRLRGNWETVQGIPAMPMTHPAYLLRTPEAKREAWLDLQDIRARLKDKQ
ncbi:MAG: uracil-DNA glycosylase [Alphaproteobacteria bacterium]|nr:uracil-DNA glycosylase [Alphaproteobacteria bacterium]